MEPGEVMIGDETNLRTTDYNSKAQNWQANQKYVENRKLIKM